MSHIGKLKPGATLLANASRTAVDSSTGEWQTIFEVDFVAEGTASPVDFSGGGTFNIAGVDWVAVPGAACAQLQLNSSGLVIEASDSVVDYSRGVQTAPMMYVNTNQYPGISQKFLGITANPVRVDLRVYAVVDFSPTASGQFFWSGMSTYVFGPSSTIRRGLRKSLGFGPFDGYTTVIGNSTTDISTGYNTWSGQDAMQFDAYGFEQGGIRLIETSVGYSFGTVTALSSATSVESKADTWHPVTWLCTLVLTSGHPGSLLSVPAVVKKYKVSARPSRNPHIG